MNLIVSLLGAVLLAAVLTDGVAAEIHSLELPHPAADFALHPRAGTMAAVHPARDTVALYRLPTADESGVENIGRASIGNTPASVVFKRSGDQAYFVVGCLRDAQVHVLDAGSLELVKRIPVGGSDVSSLACSTNAEDPHVYYCYGRGHQSRIGCINLATLRDLGQVAGGMDCAISASGEYMYVRGPFRPSGLDCLRKLQTREGELAFLSIHRQGHDAPPCVPGPFEQYAAVGEQIHSATLATEIAKLEFAPICFFEDRPTVVGIAGTKLLAASYNSLMSTAAVPLPAAFFAAERQSLEIAPAARDFKQLGYRTRAFADGARDRVVLARHHRLLLVPHALLEIPHEALLAAKVLVPEQLTVGKLAKAEIQLADKRIQLAIERAPVGVELVEQELRWTPTADQVGPAEIVLRLMHNAAMREQSFTVDVTQSFIQLPFVADHFVLSDDGKRAFCWGPPSQYRRVPNLDATRMMLVDLVAGNVTVEAHSPLPIIAASMDEHHVYVAYAGAGRLAALGMDDLAPQQQRLIDAPVTALQSIAGKYLQVSAQRGAPLWFALPELRRLRQAEGDSAAQTLPLSLSGSPLRRVNSLLLLGGVLYDADLNKPALLLPPHGFASLVETPVSDAWLQSWGRRLNEGKLLTAQGQLIRDLSGPAALLASHPVTAVVSAKQDGRHVAPQTHEIVVSLKLELRDLRFGDVQRQLELLENQRVLKPGGQPPSFAPRTAIASAQGRAVVLFEDRLFNVDPGEFPTADFPVPLHFKPTQSMWRIASAGQVTLEHPLAGGAPPYNVALAAARPELSIDSETGTVAVDGDAAARAAEEHLFQMISGRRGAAGPGAAEFAQKLQAYAQESTARFRDLFDSDPGGLPVLLPIHLRASDAAGNTAEMHYSVLVDASDESVLQRYKQHHQQLAAEEAKRETERASRQEAKVTDERSLIDRVDALEQQMNRIEGQLEVVLRLLAGRGDTSEPPPEKPPE